MQKTQMLSGLFLDMTSYVVTTQTLKAKSKTETSGFKTETKTFNVDQDLQDKTETSTQCDYSLCTTMSVHKAQ